MMRKRKVFHHTDARTFEPVSTKVARTLLLCFKIGVVTTALLTSPTGLYCIIAGGIKYYFYKSDFNRELNRLKRQGFVSLKKTPEGIAIKLLKKAKRRKRLAEFQELMLPRLKDWDGKWRFYIFDISEEQKSLRDRLTQKLKALGMYHIQKSVFAYPYDCRKELAVVAEYYKVSKDTTYVESTYTDINKELKKHFSL